MRTRLPSLLWSALGAFTVLWGLYSFVGWLAPSLLCRARVPIHCAEASMRALEAEHPDGAAAFRWSTRGCELGDVTSCNNVGVAYQRGAGVAKDLKSARREYRKACEMGSGLGCYNEAELLEDATDEAGATELAGRRYARACELEYYLGCRAALRRSPDLAGALAFAERGCKLADKPACASKALILSATRPGSPEARASASDLQEPCSKNEPVSCAVLGMLYAAGTPMPRDVPRAKELLARACRLESELACKMGKEPSVLEKMPELLPHVAEAWTRSRSEPVAQ